MQSLLESLPQKEMHQASMQNKKSKHQKQESLVGIASPVMRFYRVLLVVRLVVVVRLGALLAARLVGLLTGLVTGLAAGRLRVVVAVVVVLEMVFGVVLLSGALVEEELMSRLAPVGASFLGGTAVACAMLRARPRLSRILASACSRVMVGVRAGSVRSKLALLLPEGVRSFSLNEELCWEVSSRTGTVVVVTLNRVVDEYIVGVGESGVWRAASSTSSSTTASSGTSSARNVLLGSTSSTVGMLKVVGIDDSSSL